jgi:Ca-activated chloride channel family protein
MTFEPVLPLGILIAIIAVLIVIWVMDLRRVLRGTGPAGSRRRLVLRWSGRSLAVLLLVAAAARPGLPGGDALSASGPSAAAGSNVNVFFVVDRSVDSRVEDFGDSTSRMAGIRKDITALIDQYPGARFAVISFSSGAAVDWPLSNDVWSLKPMIAGLSTYTQGPPDAMYRVNAAAGSDILREKLLQAAHQFPHSPNLVFYFGEGAGESRAAQGGFDLGSAKVTGGAVLGYGTSAGGGIPQAFVNGELLDVVDARTGAALNSAVNEPMLRVIAGQLDVPYFHRENGQSIATVVPAVNAAGTGGGAVMGSGVVQRTELYWVFTVAAGALVLMEIYLTIRQFRRNRMARREVAL